MNNIYVFYGPNTEFMKKVPKSEVYSLTEVVSRIESKRKELVLLTSEEKIKIKNLYFENLTIESCEYSGVAEHVVENFINFLHEIDIDNIYIQNPPKKILSQLQRIYNNILKIEYYNYKKINITELKIINEKFSNKIIGQENVRIDLLAALYPLLNKNYKKPIVMIFYGPPGVGKTETAKFLSCILKAKLFRKQFSMSQTQEFADYLFGGSQNKSSFSRELLERESNIILLDEFDKSNKLFYSAFYQLFDEGIYEDNNYSLYIDKGIIICTSNYNSEDEIKEKLGHAIYSRFDAVIGFKKLTNSAKQEIMSKKYDKMYEELTEEERLTIDNNNNDDLKNILVNNISKKLENVREIDKYIKKCFSLILMEKLLK